MSDEDWVKAAMTDDSVVVELLVRLHHAPPPKRDSHLAPPLEWTVRQRRSKPVMILTNKKPTPRASPTTPLSLSSGATSVDGSEESSLPPPSAARDLRFVSFSGVPSHHRRPPALSLSSSFADDWKWEFETRSQNQWVHAMRVENTQCNASAVYVVQLGEIAFGGCGGDHFKYGFSYKTDTCSPIKPPTKCWGYTYPLSLVRVTATSGATANKRARKKKTLAELKEDETLLLKERRHLKRELATLRFTLEKQRATNENLKRLKLDLDSPTVAERVIAVASVEAIPAQTQQKLASSDPMPPILPPEVRIDDHNAKQQPSTPKDSSQLHPEVISPENKFVLPDLNQPIEDDSNSEDLHKARVKLGDSNLLDESHSFIAGFCVSRNL
ncbi:hypothetical protein Acr_23g0002520 [Actinidia rufa]|uniref:Uncharacterized protein n=1 Tax=Actinidia rufa TaxID=165716 RepID=A0A7J0GM16_9ERIC|nr:hypothetical protein Acr_23g0002520 [Actinidia rufa]